MRGRSDWSLNPAVMMANALTAFVLNLAVFLLIGKTSALTMNIAGVCTDHEHCRCVRVIVTLHRCALRQATLHHVALRLCTSALCVGAFCTTVLCTRSL